MKVSDIKENPRNPRSITDSALLKLQESIQRDPQFMLLRPIVLDEQGIVLGGNQRLKAIKALGMEEIPDGWVVYARDLTEEQRKRFVIIDNAPEGMAGGWDFELLSEDWSLPELEDFGLELPSFCDPENIEIPSDNKNIDEEAMAKTKNECPKCGFKW